MGVLNIRLQDNRTVFTPFEELHGHIQWNLPQAHPVLELTLFWYTKGKGTRDVGVVHRQHFDNLNATGDARFTFELPAGPFSFSGQLISVLWALELTCATESTSARQAIILSPSGAEIRLGKVRED